MFTHIIEFWDRKWGKFDGMAILIQFIVILSLNFLIALIHFPFNTRWIQNLSEKS